MTALDASRDFGDFELTVDCIRCARLTLQLACGNIHISKYRVVLETDEDDVFIATCPTLPRCVSQGATRDEALANIADAIEGYLASLKKHGEPIPPPITEAVVEVSI